MIGTTLDDRYEIVEQIGIGGFSGVYRATDTRMKRTVAIKILSAESTLINLQQQFSQETEWMAQFRHRHIVTIFDAGEHDRYPYLVMEMVTGVTIHDYLIHNEFQRKDILQIADQICQAMAYSHSHGIVHRDLSLKNIMIEFDDLQRPEVKILDFGLAKFMDQSLTMPLPTIGTPLYLSPEMIKNGKTDGRVDVFAFGVCLFRLLNGFFPFESEHPTAVMYLICNEDNAPFREGVPDHLREIVLKCLEKNPRARYADFNRVAEDLRNIPHPPPADSTPTRPLNIDMALIEQIRNRKNPYLNRVMIKDPREFWGRETEIRKIYSRLDASDPQSISIVGERRIGKSSLLNYIYNQGNRRTHMTNHDATVFVYMDFQSRIEFTIPTFIEMLFTVFRYECKDLPVLDDSPKNLDVLQATIETLHDQGRRVIILMDEFERITRNPNFDAFFFSKLRSLANGFNVAYITSSCGDLQNMCHNQDISDSPFFNIFANLPLRPFQPEDSLKLITEPSRERGVPLAEYADKIMALSGHYPIYLQIACSTVFEFLADHPDTDPDWPSLTRTYMDEVKPHYNFVWDQLDAPLKENLKRLATGKKISHKYEFVNEVLDRRGYLLQDNGPPRIFSDTFRDFILEKMGGQPKKGFGFSFWRRS